MARFRCIHIDALEELVQVKGKVHEVPLSMVGGCSGGRSRSSGSSASERGFIDMSKRRREMGGWWARPKQRLGRWRQRKRVGGAPGKGRIEE